MIEEYLERGTVLKEINRSLSFVDCPPVIINIVNSIILNIPVANAEYKKHGYWKFSDNSLIVNINVLSVVKKQR